MRIVISRPEEAEREMLSRVLAICRLGMFQLCVSAWLTSYGGIVSVQHFLKQRPHPQPAIEPRSLDLQGKHIRSDMPPEAGQSLGAQHSSPYPFSSSFTLHFSLTCSHHAVLSASIRTVYTASPTRKSFHLPCCQRSQLLHPGPRYPRASPTPRSARRRESLQTPPRDAHVVFHPGAPTTW